jgi:hypothetical protein
MDIATKFASGQEAVEAIFRKDKQPQGRQQEDVPEASTQRDTKKKGKKKSQAKRDAADADLVAAAEHRNLRIDQIVDSTVGCETLSFLDAYSGYHQIKMKESDQLATSFITPFGMYYYITMPFGLRNAGATYQRCMNHVFGEHISRTVEAYVDDIVVKTRKASDLLSDLETTFKCLRAKGVKLNPEKCVFGVPRGMLLGFIVSERGIEANLEKLAVITNMGPMKDLKGVQRVK